jgi:hypothetical protein
LYDWCIAIYRPGLIYGSMEWGSSLVNHEFQRAEVGDEFLIIVQGAKITEFPYFPPKTRPEYRCLCSIVVCCVVECTKTLVRILYPDEPSVSDWIPRSSLRFWKRLKTYSVPKLEWPSGKIPIRPQSFLLSSASSLVPSSAAIPSSSSSSSSSSSVPHPSMASSSAHKSSQEDEPDNDDQSEHSPSEMESTSTLAPLDPPCWTAKSEDDGSIQVQYRPIKSRAPPAYKNNQMPAIVRDIPATLFADAVNSLPS